MLFEDEIVKANNKSTSVGHVLQCYLSLRRYAFTKFYVYLNLKKQKVTSTIFIGCTNVVYFCQKLVSVQQILAIDCLIRKVFAKFKVAIS